MEPVSPAVAGEAAQERLSFGSLLVPKNMAQTVHRCLGEWKAHDKRFRIWQHAPGVLAVPVTSAASDCLGTLANRLAQEAGQEAGQQAAEHCAADALANGADLVPGVLAQLIEDGTVQWDAALCSQSVPAGKVLFRLPPPQPSASD
jgi:hypothetical protein